MACHIRLRQNLDSFHSHLLGNYDSMVDVLGGPGVLEPDTLELLFRLVRGTEHIWLDPRLPGVAFQRGELPTFVSVLADLHAAGPASAGVFARIYPGMHHSLEAVRPGITAYADSPAPGLDLRGGLVAWAFAVPDPGDRQDFLTGFANLARACPGIVARAGASLDRHFARRPAGELKEWLTRGFRLVRGGRYGEASDFFCLQSRESRSFLGLRGALLREEKEVLRIFTASLHDRGLGIQPLGVSGFLGDQPYTDGQSVFLPEEIHLGIDSDLNRRAYTAMAALLTQVTVQGTWGYDFGSAPFRYDLSERFGSLLPPIATTLARDYRNRIKSLRERRGNIMELVFRTGRSLVVLETDLERFFHSFPDALFARKIFSALELYRAEAGLGRRYEGLRQDYLRMHRVLARTIPSLDITGAAAAGAAEILKLRFLAALRLFRLQRHGQDEPVLDRMGGKSASLAEHIRGCFARAGAPDATVDTSAEETFRLYSRLADDFPLQGFLASGDPLVSWESSLEPRLDPAIVGDASPGLLHARAPRAEFLPDEEEKVKSVDITRMGVREQKARSLKEEIRTGAVRLFSYPEFDQATNTLKPRHCTLYERKLEEGDAGYCDAMLSSHRQVQNRIIKKFLALQPEEVELTRRWDEGDEIHIGDAVDYASDLLRGASADGRIYLRKTVNVRDVALQILVDASSSTRIEVGNRKIINIEKTSLLLLGSALHRIGDDFSISCFNSAGADKVFFHTAKEFDEPWNRKVRSRIDSMEPSGANRDGCAIRHATARLAARDNRTRILLLLSDGIPADPGYGDSDGIETSGYALEDTRRALLEARRSGVIPFCLTIDTEAKDYIGHLYGDRGFSVLSDVEMLPQRLARLYIRLTG